MKKILAKKIIAKKNSGITLMELTIVLAILAIIAAIVVPLFLLTTDRARLRGDIQSARVIQNAMDLYRIERGRSVEGGTDIPLVVQNLERAGYINPRNVAIQTEGAVWVVAPQFGVRVNIAASPEEVHRAYAGLPPEERQYVQGGVSPP